MEEIKVSRAEMRVMLDLAEDCPNSHAYCVPGIGPVRLHLLEDNTLIGIADERSYKFITEWRGDPNYVGQIVRCLGLTA